ncbi:helix-turn-helix domain-containing protein [Pseudoroseicyclus tamaricis]|uniref:Helix-turn-helix domain-containing protein n=1 Tax=Pseudoroseicyclus tamaricis TaxID=2705421 RepID=A0A6B2JW52_9RHOB|nr:helix-turn-helix domain-containing protein [Pseudoroseicyclus tamaricis]NDV00444.1 helix-turn-helix domain-containing protein [Pseudoroseicyclus tamaricis]
MIGRGFRRDKDAQEDEAKGFDAFELRLGDLMRGERATMGKSLLDVQRELRIKAAYIAAIENCDPTAFDTPGFIAGYVRSYARYLNMDPDWAFDTFCRESGFVTAHGMSESASSVKPTREERMAASGVGRDIFASSTTPFIPAGERMFSGIEPRAIGSLAVLGVLIAGLGYGGWSLLQEVQKVQFAPVEQPPVVLSDVDPLAGATRGAQTVGEGDELASMTLPSAEALERLYRPQALDVPVLTRRDGPIASLDPDSIGALAPGGSGDPRRDRQAEMLAASLGGVTAPQVAPGDVGSGELGTAALADAGAELPAPRAVQVTEGEAPEVMLVAVRPAWLRVRAASGTVIFEGILDAGQTYELPQTEEPATVRIGESGALYFAVNGQHYGPAGPRGAVTDGIVLAAEALTEEYAAADLADDADLAEYVRVAEAPLSD